MSKQQTRKQLYWVGFSWMAFGTIIIILLIAMNSCDVTNKEEVDRIEWERHMEEQRLHYQETSDAIERHMLEQEVADKIKENNRLHDSLGRVVQELKEIQKFQERRVHGH